MTDLALFDHPNYSIIWWTNVKRTNEKMPLYYQGLNATCNQGENKYLNNWLIMGGYQKGQ